ncbi:MAG: hypothetical protein CR967_03465 [Proteobacteria bacterium]|nr:MAG: hypothetical protein CR967_03465 [Pseudomonadota bacterium]
MASPFPYESFASHETFYGRKKEIKTILDFANSSNNLVIYSKRRLGKSSLIKEAFRGRDEYLFIYCDVFDISSKEDFAKKLINSLPKSINGDLKKAISSLSKIFKRVNLSYTIDPNSGKVSIRPELRALSYDDMMEEFFNAIFELSKKQKVVLAIDEFQQIAQIKDAKISARLREYMQMGKNISYVFLGSKRHMLNSLFEYKAPLFEQATPMHLGSLKIDDIYNFSSKHLKISKDLVEYIFDLCHGETKLMQHIFHLLYQNFKRRKISQELIILCLDEIINAKSSAYKIIYDSFSLNQKKAFKILSKYKKNIYTKELLDEFGISKDSMQSSLKALFKREIVDKEDEVWFIPDRAFEIWGERF